jgi:S1-C subfamily serine protease
MRNLVMSAVLFGLLVSPATAQSFDPYKSIGEIRTSRGQGSGTAIARSAYGHGLVVSCRHVNVREGDRVTVAFLWSTVDRDPIPARVIAIVPGARFDSDLALVMTDRLPSDVRMQPVYKFDPAGGPWVAAGFRSGRLRVTSPAIQEAVHRSDGLIVIPTPLIPGQSGGPLYDRYGRVVGIVVASDFRSTGLAADGEALHGLVRKFTH